MLALSTSRAGSASLTTVSTSSYHHGNLREALVDAAVEVARDRGPDGLAVRDLARRVGVSHNAAYRHFADREALLEEVATRGLAALIGAMQARLVAVESDPDRVRRARRRLCEVGRGYVDFAVTEPGLFRVLFSAYPEVHQKVGADAARDPFSMLNDVLDDLVEVGFLASASRPGSEIQCWSVVHGFAVLHVEGPLRVVPAAQRDSSLVGVLLAVDQGYAATSGGRWDALELDP